MRRWLVFLIAVITAVGIGVAPPAAAAGVPIGNLGETLRVEFKGIVADVTVHDVAPHRPAARLRADGLAALAGPRWPVACECHRARDPGAEPVHHVDRIRRSTASPPTATRTHRRTPTRPTPCSTRCRTRLQGRRSTARVYWQVYRDLVTNVILLNPQTGTHLAQWNIWQPGTPLP